MLCTKFKNILKDDKSDKINGQHIEGNETAALDKKKHRDRKKSCTSALPASQSHEVPSRLLSTLKEQTERTLSTSKGNTRKKVMGANGSSFSTTPSSSNSHGWMPEAPLSPLEKFYHTHVAKYDNRLIEASLSAGSKMCGQALRGNTERPARKLSGDNTIVSVASLRSEFDTEEASSLISKKEAKKEQKIPRASERTARCTAGDVAQLGTVLLLDSELDENAGEGELIKTSDESCTLKPAGDHCWMKNADEPKHCDDEEPHRRAFQAKDTADRGTQAGLQQRNLSEHENETTKVSSVEEDPTTNSISNQCYGSTSMSGSAESYNAESFVARVSFEGCNLNFRQANRSLGVEGKYAQIIFLDKKVCADSSTLDSPSTQKGRKTDDKNEKFKNAAEKIFCGLPINICGENIYIDIGRGTANVTSPDKAPTSEAHPNADQPGTTSKLSNNTENTGIHQDVDMTEGLYNGKESTLDGQGKCSVKEEENEKNEEKASMSNLLEESLKHEYLDVLTEKNKCIKTFKSAENGFQESHDDHNEISQNFDKDSVHRKHEWKTDPVDFNDKCEEPNDYKPLKSVLDAEFLIANDTELTKAVINDLIHDSFDNCETKDNPPSCDTSEYPSSLSGYGQQSSEKCSTGTNSQSKGDDGLWSNENLLPLENSELQSPNESTKLSQEIACSSKVDSGGPGRKDTDSTEEVAGEIEDASHGFEVSALTLEHDETKEGPSCGLSTSLAKAGISKHFLKNLSDMSGHVDVYLLKNAYNSQRCKLKKEINKYRDRVQTIARLKQHIEQVTRETEHMRNLVEGANRQTAALKSEAMELRYTLSAVCDISASTVGAETDARRLEPNCYRRYLNIRNASDATNALNAVRNRIKALNDLEVLIYRRQLILYHALPSPATTLDKQSGPKPLTRATKFGNKVQKANRQEQTESGTENVVIQVITPLPLAPGTPSWSEEQTPSDSQSTATMSGLNADELASFRTPEPRL